MNELERQNSLLRREERGGLAKCNEYTKRYGLKLSEKDIEELCEHRQATLRQTGRMEWGGGVMQKLIYAFCDSPYIQADDYVQTLEDLEETFYYFKNEALDEISDDELIEYMKRIFDGAGQGSVEYLAQTGLERLTRSVRFGTPLGEENEGGDGDTEEDYD